MRAIRLLLLIAFLLFSSSCLALGVAQAPPTTTYPDCLGQSLTSDGVTASCFPSLDKSILDADNDNSVGMAESISINGSDPNLYYHAPSTTWPFDLDGDGIWDVLFCPESSPLCGVGSLIVKDIGVGGTPSTPSVFIGGDLSGLFRDANNNGVRDTGEEALDADSALKIKFDDTASSSGQTTLQGWVDWVADRFANLSSRLGDLSGRDEDVLSPYAAFIVTAQDPLDVTPGNRPSCDSSTGSGNVDDRNHLIAWYTGDNELYLATECPPADANPVWTKRGS
jgi:hypothetical protein